MALRKSRLVWPAIFALVAYWLAWPWPFAAERGRLAAKFDLALGRNRLLAVGLPSPWTSEYSELLKTRFGITYQQKAFCLVSPSLVQYVQAYDRMSVPAARQKYNRDVFQECYNEAKAHWEEKRDKMRMAGQTPPP